MRLADTCPAKGEAPARPGGKNERPPTGHRIATGPAAGAGKAAGAEGDYTVAGRSLISIFSSKIVNIFFAIELMNIH